MKEIKRKRGRPPKQTSLAQDYSNIEEEIQKSSVIKNISQAITDISEALVNISQTVEINKKTDEELNQKILQTEQKISSLAQAVSLLNDEFSKFINALQGNALNMNPNSNPNPNPSSVPNPDSNPVADTPSRGDKLMQWVSILARLAQISNPPQQVEPVSSTEQELGKGFNLMVGAFTKLLEIQSAFRKHFLAELKETFNLLPQALKTSKITEKREEKEHLE